MKQDPLILGIESSCDETAAAVIRGRELLSDEIASSAATQAKYGGVVPEIASRAHAEAVDEVVARALKAANVQKQQLDAVAVTYGAGLLGALLVGLSFAKGFAYGLNIPLIGVDHIRGHLAAAYLEDTTLEPPFITLLASGGHTAILYAERADKFRVLGGTLDDAAGEAFDKVARVLGLPYPGGPHVEALAREGSPVVPMHKMLKGMGGYDFSYSGLKTAVINYVHTKEQRGEEWSRADVAASFQSAALDILVQKTIEGAHETGAKVVTAGGGVAANGHLREKLTKACAEAGLKLVLPVKKHCTDNAAMIASEGLVQYRLGHFSPMSLNAEASIPLRHSL
ncbi:MAG TPA: tRNA (adenosine(37)-N6)-threonylcarbamoyltransferase complex transferase subunit TsaD [Candidatus Gallimonas intestinigallinarum]|uniref:tRNA N6-adenosine threonylcarbamoyltransferase n=1 Tax=Candidatus Gallimonas intestinigallinarum TaxID=2838604 RepID=A0A9D2DY81_9FIRM|nr:tRNA (adenosine(37)-N6)-threonylcarbamoyltransferase complex transferase subunit TsaD [Candidatus Gallimonas intestinigallinarum]